MTQNEQPIVIIDSGYGGIEVLRTLSPKLKGEDIIYFADSGHAPYGNKKKKELRHRVTTLLSFVKEANAKILVLACNTLDSIYIDTFRTNLDIPVISIIDATISRMPETHKKVCLLATDNTIQSQAYFERSILAHDMQFEMIALGCPQFAQSIEDEVEKNDLKKTILQTLQPIQRENFQTLILGCTHYTAIQKEILQTLSRTDITCVDSSECVSEEVVSYITRKDLKHPDDMHKKLKLYTTGDVEKFTAYVANRLHVPFETIAYKES